MRNVNARQGGIFEFTKLPGEIKNKIYSDLLRPYRHLCELTGRPRDFIEPNLLHLNKAINVEASSILFESVVTVCIGPADTILYRPALHTLAGASRFKRLAVDIDLNGPATQYPRASEKTGRLLEVIHRASVQISKLPCLRELTLKAHWPEWDWLWLNGVQYPLDICPDSYLKCFYVVKGLERVNIEGDLNKDLAMELKQSMTKPDKPADASFTLDDLFKKLVQNRCMCMSVFAPASWTLGDASEL
ncbi:MAG: hypothetical protein Q9163_000847 [Psora crenata]